MNMKQNNRTIMKKIFGYITLAIALTACGSDEALQEYEHQQDKYPLQFTATVEDGTETRVTADNEWSDGDEIGIQIGTSGEQQGMYKYAANDDGNGTWSPEIPVSWQEGQTADVTAWYPYDSKENADISNQADGYTQYEFLKAEATGQSSQQTVNLTFKHQMAKVMCRVQDKDSEFIRGVKVRFRGVSSVTFDKGAVTATGTRGKITPYSIDHGDYTTYVALLAPQTIASGESFIEVTANGKTYRFEPNAEIVLEAGKSHNYKITIGDKVDYTIDDNGTYHVYTAEGLKAWAAAANASPYNASCTLENNITMTDENNWMPVCPSRDTPYTGTFNGNGKSISGLNISSDASYVGFIGRLGEGGAVKNLTLEVANMSSTGSSAIIGAVAGSNIGTISDCHVINTTISGKFRAGGVAGSNNGIVSYCHVSDDCSVKGESDSFLFLGGIAGQNESSGKITACYALCSLSVTGLGSKRVGGVFGSSTGSCTACYSCCKLLGAPDYAGGISGNNPGTVIACYWANVPNATNVFGKGIGNGTDNTVKVDGSTVTWSAAAEAMNKALGADCGYQYKVNGSSQTEPLKLVEKQ